MNIKSILAVALLLVSFLGEAQTHVYSVKSKKAIRILEEGQRLYEGRSYDEALVLAEKAIKKEAGFIEAHILKGYIHMAKNDVGNAIASIENAIKINSEFFPALKLDLGGLYFRVQRYEDCKAILADYLKKNRPKERQKRKATFFIKCADFSIKAIANPLPINPENLGPNINSEFKDYLPVLSIDQGTLIYTRTIPDSRNIDGRQEDFYASFQENGVWQPSFNIGAPINTEVNEGGHTLSPDGQMMFFTICEQYGNYGQGRSGSGSCDLFITVLRNGKWAKPRNVGPAVNSQFHDAQPSMSSDGRTLYFSSARPGGYGANDIYVTTMTSAGWTVPKNLGDVINTPGREEGVFIHPDNQTLYFASTGHPGLGQSDIFMSKRQADGSWGTPINLGYPINSGQDEFDFTVDALGDYAYITSDRKGGFGDWDIYKFKMPEVLKPKPVNYMAGNTYNVKTKAPVSASFELINLSSGEKVVQSESNNKGDFLVCLPTGQDYALNVAKEGFLFYSENFNLKETKDFKPTHKDVPLQPIEVGSKVVLKNVFFDLDKFTLKPESAVELKKLVDFLEKNPTLKVEIGGHTDNQGSKSHNQTLSENRSKAVMDWLISNGVEATRLSSKGYADSVPLQDNNTPEGRAENRRTEFKITGNK